MKETFNLKPTFPKEENKEKVEWIACASWFLKKLINKGKLKGFENKDAQLLKHINKGYNRAYKNIHHEDSWNYLMMTDEMVEKVSNNAYKRLRELYNIYGKEYSLEV